MNNEAVGQKKLNFIWILILLIAAGRKVVFLEETNSDKMEERNKNL